MARCQCCRQRLQQHQQRQTLNLNLTSRDAATPSAVAMLSRRPIMASWPSGLNRNLVQRDASGSMMLQGKCDERMRGGAE